MGASHCHRVANDSTSQPATVLFGRHPPSLPPSLPPFLRMSQMIYLMQDAVSPDVQRILGLNVKRCAVIHAVFARACVPVTLTCV